MMAPEEIVILGGGIGGTLVANLLARKLTRKQANITVIDRTGRHIYQPGWLYIPFGGAPPERLERAERSRARISSITTRRRCSTTPTDTWFHEA